VVVTVFGGAKASSDVTGPPSVVGPSKDLVGKWERNQGFVLIAMPTPGSHPDDKNSDFRLLSFPYRDIFEIEANEDGVRNRGGSIDQNNGVCIFGQQTNFLMNLINKASSMKIMDCFYLDSVTTNNGPVSSKDRSPIQSVVVLSFPMETLL